MRTTRRKLHDGVGLFFHVTAELFGQLENTQRCVAPGTVVQGTFCRTVDGGHGGAHEGRVAIFVRFLVVACCTVSANVTDHTAGEVLVAVFFQPTREGTRMRSPCERNGSGFPSTFTACGGCGAAGGGLLARDRHALPERRSAPSTRPALLSSKGKLKLESSEIAGQHHMPRRREGQGLDVSPRLGARSHESAAQWHSRLFGVEDVIIGFAAVDQGTQGPAPGLGAPVWVTVQRAPSH